MSDKAGNKPRQEINSIRPDLPVIICTGFSEKNNKEEASTIGVKGFLMKPIVIKDLSKMIREVLDKKQDK